MKSRYFTRRSTAVVRIQTINIVLSKTKQLVILEKEDVDDVDTGRNNVHQVLQEWMCPIDRTFGCLKTLSVCQLEGAHPLFLYQGCLNMALCNRCEDYFGQLGFGWRSQRANQWLGFRTIFAYTVPWDTESETSILHQFSFNNAQPLHQFQAFSKTNLNGCTLSMKFLQHTHFAYFGVPHHILM